MCDVMVSAMVLTVLLLDSSFVVRPANLLFCVYPPCAAVTIPKLGVVGMPLGYGGVDVHVCSALGLRSQSSRLCWYSPVHTMRLSALIRSCCVVYRFLARVEISCMSVHLLNRISGGSCRLYSAKKLTLF